MFTIAPVYVVAAIAAAVESTRSLTTVHERTGCDVVASFEREIEARRGSGLTGPEAESLLSGAAVLRASLCPSRLGETAPARAA
jgi:hypothetical protein